MSGSDAMGSGPTDRAPMIRGPESRGSESRGGVELQRDPDLDEVAALMRRTWPRPAWNYTGELLAHYLRRPSGDAALAIGWRVRGRLGAFMAAVPLTVVARGVPGGPLSAVFTSFMTADADASLHGAIHRLLPEVLGGARDRGYRLLLTLMAAGMPMTRAICRIYERQGFALTELGAMTHWIAVPSILRRALENAGRGDLAVHEDGGAARGEAGVARSDAGVPRSAGGAVCGAAGATDSAGSAAGSPRGAAHGATAGSVGGEAGAGSSGGTLTGQVRDYVPGADGDRRGCAALLRQHAHRFDVAALPAEPDLDVLLGGGGGRVWHDGGTVRGVLLARRREVLHDRVRRHLHLELVAVAAPEREEETAAFVRAALAPLLVPDLDLLLAVAAGSPEPGLLRRLGFLPTPNAMALYGAWLDGGDGQPLPAPVRSCWLEVF